MCDLSPEGPGGSSFPGVVLGRSEPPRCSAPRFLNDRQLICWQEKIRIPGTGTVVRRVSGNRILFRLGRKRQSNGYSSPGWDIPGPCSSHKAFE